MIMENKNMMIVYKKQLIIINELEVYSDLEQYGHQYSQEWESNTYHVD